MREPKMVPTTATVGGFIDKVEPPGKRADSYEIIDLMKNITGQDPVMWGPSIIGFGKYHYKYASGHEGDAPLAAFSPRKTNIVIYLLGTLLENKNLIQKLGKCKTSKVCLYIKKLSDVDKGVLEELIKKSYEWTKSK